MKYKKAKFTAFVEGDESFGLFTVGKNYEIIKFHDKAEEGLSTDAFEVISDIGMEAYCLREGCAFGYWELIS